MTLNQLLEAVAPAGASIIGKEKVEDGWIIYIGRPVDMVFPYAVAHGIPLHVETLDNPEIHPEEEKAVLRRFDNIKKRPARA